MKVNNYPLKTPSAGDKLFGSDSNGDQKQFDVSNFDASTYKKYVALISQTGTSAPTATVLENTLGGTIVWTRTAAGAYTGTLTGAFTNNKTFLLMGTIPYLNNPAYILDRSSDNTVYIQASVNNIQSDNLLSNTSIEIRVYN